MNKNLLIIIPERYENRLNSLKDGGKLWLGKILQFIKNTQDFISQSPFFFPEYTKHTVEHINNVLNISVNLIPKDTMEKLNSDTLAVLIFGIISHDIGMFIKPEGLKYLLDYKNETNEEKSFWKMEWENYQIQLRHYSDTEIKKYFGDPEKFIINDGLELMQLPKDITPGKLLEWRKRLCGEFLRKMHPKLAQEIINEGFPGEIPFDLFTDIEMDSEYRKLIGIVAKSHGMGINELDSELKIFDEDVPEYPCGIPIYYVMAILRLADYLDAGEDRAPHAIAYMQKFESEVSYDEFKWNQIVNLDNDWGKKNHEREFVKIKLSNIDSRMFLKVEEWLISVQRELDACWRQISLNYKGDYQLSIRRIDSNIFQKTTRKDLENKIVIEKAQLQAAPEILDLLIAPLYGGEVTYGVRELLQNAIDTCRERKVIESKKGNNLYEGMVQVEINSECETPFFSITDNGCGMNKEIILKYFLVAGSSFRNSTKWKEKYEDQNVKRSGKFGIGVLASFLLGNSIRVETKPLNEKKSYCLKINKNNFEQINIWRNNKIENPFIAENEGGSQIKIEIGHEDADKMIKVFRKGAVFSAGNGTYWAQWYWLSTPKVQYIINGIKWNNPYAFVTNGKLCGLQENKNWFQLKEKSEFDGIWWTPVENRKFWCNGIFITDNYDEKIDPFGSRFMYDFYIRVPSIAVLDSNNVLNLSLSRNEVLDFPEAIRKKLYIENCKLALSLLMMIDFSEQNELYPVFPFVITQEKSKMDYPVFCKKGYNLPWQRILRQIKGQTIWCLYNEKSLKHFPFDKLNCVVRFLHFWDLIDDEIGSRDGLFNAFHMGSEKNLLFETIQIKKTHIYNYCDETPSAGIDKKEKFSEHIEELANLIYDDETYDELFDYESGMYFPFVYEIKSDKNDYLIASKNKNILNSNITSKDIYKYFDVACGYYVKEDDCHINFMIERLLDKYLGDEIWIPYDIEERKKKFPKFFDPKSDIYKYVLFVGREKGFYDVRTL